VTTHTKYAPLIFNTQGSLLSYNVIDWGISNQQLSNMALRWSDIATL